MTVEIESYQRDVIASDGAVLSDCFRIVREVKQCLVYDMRYYMLPPNAIEFIGLSPSRFEEFKAGTASAVYIGRVWIGKTGEWNVDYAFPAADAHMWNLPINKCLRLMGYHGQ